MQLELAGKVALVTGAGSGIGKAVSLRMAREGASLVAADLNAAAAQATAEEATAMGREVLALQVDVRDLGQLQAMVDAAVERFGRIDILVPSAGIVQPMEMLEMTETDWDRMFAVNTKGVFFTLQMVARQMIRQGSGTIVTIASGAARGPRPYWIHYGASKAAVISITQSAAAALASHGITVNTVCPGVIATPMWDQIDQDMHEKSGMPVGEFRGRALQKVPLGRAGTAEDVANAVVFLASPQASYITGQALNINGGSAMH